MFWLNGALNISKFSEYKQQKLESHRVTVKRALPGQGKIKILNGFFLPSNGCTVIM